MFPRRRPGLVRVCVKVCDTKIFSGDAGILHNVFQLLGFFKLHHSVIKNLGRGALTFAATVDV